MNLVAPKTCRKCKGTGDFYYVSGAIGSCSRCLGEGVVEGDKAAIAAYKARQDEHARLYLLLKALADQAPIFGRTFSLCFASDGLYLLEELEPERYAKAVSSIEAGHPQVVQALSDYFVARQA